MDDLKYLARHGAHFWGKFKGLERLELWSLVREIHFKHRLEAHPSAIFIPIGSNVE